MGIFSKIRDAVTKDSLRVNPDGSIIVEISAKPPLDEGEVELPFQSFFLNQLDSEAMNITPVLDTNDLFCINSSDEEDIYITHMTVIISDAGATLDKFGGITALSNGIDFFYESSRGKSTVAQPLVKNLDFFRASTGGDGFGTGDEAFRADIQGGQALLTYLPKFDFKNLYGLTHGLRLRAGSRDRICIRIQDDLNLIDTFNAQAYGKLR